MQKYKILVADDVKINRRLLREIFLSDCYIYEAADGREALTMLRASAAEGETPYDVVVLDVQMPNMTGLQVLEAMKADERLRDIPAIVITAADETENELKALQLGAEDYIIKPFDSRIVRQRVLSSLIRKEVENLRISIAYKDRLQFLLDKVAGGALLADYDGKDTIQVNYSNQTCRRITGYVGSSGSCFSLFDVFHPADLEIFKSALRKTVEFNEPLDVEVRFRRGDGSIIWLLLRGSLVEGQGSKKQLFLLLLDVTEKVKATQELNYLTHYDELTQIYNRHSFARRAREIIDASPHNKYNIGVINIRGFRVIKELYGLESSDAALKTFAFKLRNELHYGTVCGRYEGDRFLICYVEGKLDLPVLLERVSGAVSAVLNGYPVNLSVGIYEATDPTLPVDRMVDMAMFALDSVEEESELTIIHYDEEMRQKVLYKQSIINDAPNAFANNELVIYYQPQYNYYSRKLVGFEALVRWNHPERGLLTPFAFIDIFEKNGFISSLDAYVFENVCAQLRKWMDDGLKVVPVSVNMSRVTIHTPNLISNINRLTQKYGIPVELVKIEVTETAYADSAALGKVVDEIKKQGFVVQMDDFGSGYSSFNTLKDISVDVLKLDMRFLQGEYSHGKAGSILNSIIRMARWLNVAVIAEGVETYEQAEYLKSMGCILMQGYYFAKPMEVGAATKLLTDEAIGDFPCASTLKQADMWNPDGTSAVVFNQYVGAAIVLEYAYGSVELQKANDKFYTTTGLTDDDILGHAQDFSTLIDVRDRQTFIEGVAAVALGGLDSETDIECRMAIRKDGLPLWVRFHVYTVAASEDRTLLLARVENITTNRFTLNELDAKNKVLFAVLNNTPNGIALFEVADKGYKLIYCNDKIYEMKAFTREQYEKLFADGKLGFIYEDDVNDMNDAIHKCVATQEIQYTSTRMRCGDGVVRHFNGALCYADVLMHGNPVLVRICYKEDSLQGELDVRWKEEKYRLITQSYGSLVFDYDVASSSFNYTITFLGSGKSREGTILNYPHYVAKNKIFTPKELKRLLATLAKITVKAGSGEYEYIANSFGKGARWYRMHYVAVADNEQKVYRVVGMVEDIQTQKDIEEQRAYELKELTYRATFDSITGLLNRSATEEYVNTQLAAKTKHIAFYVCDLDNFKDINDNHGHLVGDELLKEVGAILRMGKHSPKDVMGRVGGDEFASLLFDIKNESEMIERGEIFLRQVAKLQAKLNLHFPVSASIGAVLVPQGKFAFKDIFRMADAAMYAAKNAGKNRVVVYNDKRSGGGGEIR